MTHTKPPRKSYSEKLKDPKWQKRRLEVLNRDEFSCKLCADKETTLHVHHLKYTKEPWDAPLEDLQTLCEDCHKIIEGLKDDWKGEFVTAIVKYKPTLPSFGPTLMSYFLVLDDDYIFFRMEDERNCTYSESGYIDSAAVSKLEKYRANVKAIL